MSTNDNNNNDNNKNKEKAAIANDSRELCIGYRLKENRREYSKRSEFIVKGWIATGGFSSVYEVECIINPGDVNHPTRRVNAACKVVHRQRLKTSVRERKIFANDVRIHKTLTYNTRGHRNILNMLKVTEAGDYYLIITELCHRESLNTIVKKEKLELSVIKNYFRQSVEGLNYIHKSDIIYRDINLGNTLLSRDKSTVKICDFGFACFESELDNKNRTIYGTPNYLAIEILNQMDYIHIEHSY
jgi:serine/threonine protein kinase